MKIGTKSILFGAHQFLIHPAFVFLAWWKLYGFPWDPRLWLAFFLHDLGYIGKPNMDGLEGDTHPRWAAARMNVFGKRWRDLCLYHSRFYAKRDGAKPSRLCFADKLAMPLEPRWLYLPRVIWSGEIDEYMSLAVARAGSGEPLNKHEMNEISTLTPKTWHRTVSSYMRRYAYEHADGREDTWTPDNPASREEA